MPLLLVYLETEIFDFDGLNKYSTDLKKFYTKVDLIVFNPPLFMLSLIPQENFFQPDAELRIYCSEFSCSISLFRICLFLVKAVHFFCFGVFLNLGFNFGFRGQDLIF